MTLIYYSTHFDLSPTYICVMQVHAINAIPFNVVVLLRQLQERKKKKKEPTAFYIWAHFWCSRCVFVPLTVQAQQTPTKALLNSQTDSRSSSSSSSSEQWQLWPRSEPRSCLFLGPRNKWVLEEL